MINPSTAPTSPNSMPAGLGALTQMSPTPKGRSPSNMGEIMAMARKMSDAQLADVLQGKSLDVPQFAAMTEAMGRKSLRNAVQGAQAQGQANQPSLKDKLLAENTAQQMPEDTGIAQIPAPNMESMNMASGGIIAFDDGGEVPRFSGAFDPSLIEGYGTKQYDPYAIKRAFEKRVAAEEAENPKPLANRNFVPGANNTDASGAPIVTQPPTQDQTQAQTKTPPQIQNPRAGVNPNAGVNPSAGTLGSVEDEIAKYSDKYSKMFPEAEPFAKRNNPFSAVKYEGDSAEKTREQGLGAGLMMAASGLLKNPTFAGGLGDAMKALGEQGWITAKEVKAAQKDEREFNKDMAKANELYEQGQEEKAYKYATLAQGRQEKIASLALNTVKAKTEQFTAQSTADYQKGKLDVDRMQAGKPDSGIALLNALKNPENMAIYQQMNRAKKGEAYSIDKAVDDFNKLKKDAAENPQLAKDLKKLNITTPFQYQQYVLQQQDTIESNPFQNSAMAIAKERGLIK